MTLCVAFNKIKVKNVKKEAVKKSVVKMATGLPVFNPHAAGIDIGDTLHCVAINDGNGGHEIYMKLWIIV